MKLLTELRADITSALSHVRFDNRQVILLEGPQHRNIGDHLIWLGELKFLQEVGAKLLSFTVSEPVSTLNRVIDRDTLLLLHGGGNWGDLWPEVHQRRLSILNRFRSSEIVAFPQTVFFTDEASVAPTAAAMDRCANMTLLVRDGVSLAFANKWFPGSRNVLCPDMAFWLSVPVDRSSVEGGTVLLKRSDRELKVSAQLRDYVETADAVLDWGQIIGFHGGFRDELLYFMARVLARAFRSSLSVGWRIDLANSMHILVQRTIAKGWLTLALRLLNRYSHVVTTRLHGHILATLARIPNTLLANSYHKNKEFYLAWTREDPISRFHDG